MNTFTCWVSWKPRDKNHTYHDPVITLSPQLNCFRRPAAARSALLNVSILSQKIHFSRNWIEYFSAPVPCTELTANKSKHDGDLPPELHTKTEQDRVSYLYATSNRLWHVFLRRLSLPKGTFPQQHHIFWLLQRREVAGMKREREGGSSQI